MSTTEIKIGDTLTCAETGKTFVAALDGCSTNYARDREGNVYSDEGVDIREKRSLLDRSKPYTCYVASDGKSVTGWKGNVLGRITDIHEDEGSGRRRTRMTHVRVIDVHGGKWYGKGEGRGMIINLYPNKG